MFKFFSTKKTCIKTSQVVPEHLVKRARVPGEMTSLLNQYKITDKAAWREFLLHNHPDKGGNPDVFMAVKSAYEAHGPQPVETAKISKDESMRRELFGDAYKLFTQQDLFQAARKQVMTPAPNQCECTTKKGTRCKNNIIKGTKACSYHTPKRYKPLDIDINDFL